MIHFIEEMYFLKNSWFKQFNISFFLFFFFFTNIIQHPTCVTVDLSDGRASQSFTKEKCPQMILVPILCVKF